MLLATEFLGWATSIPMVVGRRRGDSVGAPGHNIWDVPSRLSCAARHVRVFKGRRLAAHY